LPDDPPNDDAALTALRRLPLRRILWGAFALPWQNRAAVARATGLPLLALIGCTLAWDVADLNDSGAARWTLYFLYLIATSWLAIATHRLVLLDGDDARTRPDPPGLRRLGIFVGTMILLWLVFLVLVMVLHGLMLLPWARYVPAGTQPAPVTDMPVWWINQIAIILAAWVLGRLSPVLPAIAVDRRIGPITAWRASRKNGWKLAIVIGALPWALAWVAGLLYRDGASPVEFALLAALTALFTIIEVTALSLSYWELISPAPPPTPPPG
jgi:hypothetical protein